MSCRIVKAGETTAIVCGPRKVAREDRCGVPECWREHGFLCDQPVSDGKTCDVKLCKTHAIEVAEDRHLCPKHWAMGEEKKRV